jgi:hypothetical protein
MRLLGHKMEAMLTRLLGVIQHQLRDLGAA